MTRRSALRRTLHRNPLASRALVRLDRARGEGRWVHWDALAAHILVGGYDHVSVDIFDTVLVRPVVGRGNEVWLVGVALAEQGLWAGPAEDYVAARRSAAARLPLAPLAGLAQALVGESGDADRAVAVEAELELEVSEAVPGAADGLARLRAGGVGITFLSDMHLSSDVIWRMLADAGVSRPEDRLLVSTELGASKAAGSLFGHLPTGSRTIHVGNDLWGDVAMAERAGVEAIAITSAEATPSEALMAQRLGGVGAAVAGAARRARLGCRTGAPAGDRLAALGADVAGQCLTAFLLWARDQCEQEGIRSLAFLARDGELPLRMARAMPADHWTGASLSYLEGNRTAWSLAAAEVQGVDTWLREGSRVGGALHQDRHVLPLEALLRRVGLTADQLPPTHPLRRLDPTAPLPTDEGEAWEELLASDHGRELIGRQAAERHALVVAHLRAAHRPGERLALIDVGWSGRLAGQLTALFRDAVEVEPLHLHVGGSKTVGDPGAIIRRFAVDDAVAPLPFDAVVSCVETFTQNGKARNVGFEWGERGTVRLVYDRAAPGVDNDARRFVHDAAVATARALPSRAQLQRWQLAPHPLDGEVRAILTSFWTRPEVTQAQAVGALHFETDDAGSIVGPIAAPYQVREALGLRAPVPRQWREGSLAITPQPFRTVMRALFALGARGRR